MTFTCEPLNLLGPKIHCLVPCNAERWSLENGSLHLHLHPLRWQLLCVFLSNTVPVLPVTLPVCSQSTHSTSLSESTVNNNPLIVHLDIRSEKVMAPHFSTPAWKIPWMEEPGRLQSMGSRRVGHDFTFTFHFHALEKEMATHSSVLAWRIPGTGEPSGLPSTGPHRVRHDWSDLAAADIRCPQGRVCFYFAHHWIFDT